MKTKHTLKPKTLKLEYKGKILEFKQSELQDLRYYGPIIYNSEHGKCTEPDCVGCLKAKWAKEYMAKRTIWEYQGTDFIKVCRAMNKVRNQKQIIDEY